MRDECCFEHDQFAGCNRLADLTAIRFAAPLQRLLNKPHSGEAVPVLHDEHGVEPHRFQPRCEKQGGIEARGKSIPKHGANASGFLPNLLEAARWTCIGQRSCSNSRPERGSQHVGTVGVTRLIAVERCGVSVAIKGLRGGFEQRSDRGVVRRDKRREKLSHAVHAAPLITGEHTNGMHGLSQDLVVFAEPKTHRAANRLIKSLKIVRVDRDIRVSDLHLLSRLNTTDRPGLWCGKCRTRRELDGQRCQVLGRRVGHGQRANKRDRVLPGGVVEALLGTDRHTRGVTRRGQARGVFGSRHGQTRLLTYEETKRHGSRSALRRPCSSNTRCCSICWARAGGKQLTNLRAVRASASIGGKPWCVPGSLEHTGSTAP